ncbi:MAG: 50S ribosomal protein L25 [Verrucomicrobia bacterium]|nr:MAG: 50S ribosomal protein L25 [Verrucomicrobiota bacterium]TAE87144.1 MAG: 50S ribosomal protein L25 [Verrucomicrobiota bacterium]TAF24948.1 MAG: 50S ribosomal protein L25 [Verrucomicrobiota bacterium]TAF40725.1 MAG: 50S ribosomal protein L25 [Verrucomicrobiota bacterium]
MATKHVLKAEPRQRTGSGVLKQMRREGWVPSVIYGRGTANQNLKVDAKAFSELLAHSTSDNILINLDLGGVNQLAFLKAIQHDALSGNTLHADFMAIDESTEITALIPVHLSGEPVGVKAGGLLEQMSHTLEIRCAASKLPDTLEFDVTHLQEGDLLHIGDVKLPEGVVATHASDVVIAHVVKSAAAVSEGSAA